MTKPTVIAIDGTAASGKGTLARRLAAHLGYAYLDTGTLYRRVGLDVLHAGGSPTDLEIIIGAAENLQKARDLSVLDDPKIRSAEAGRMASIVGAVPEVRHALIAMQRNFATNPPPLSDGSAAKGAVIDGRDIGTVICPDAPLKFFIDADIEIRAERRHRELQAGGDSAITYETVLSDMKIRDARDAGRTDAPMKAAPDAILIDTTLLGPDEVFNLAVGHL